MDIAFAGSMSWFSVLPVVATLLAEAPASVPPDAPVVVPIGADEPVASPPAAAPQAPTGTDGAREIEALPGAQKFDAPRYIKELKKLHVEYLATEPKTVPRWYGAPMVAADLTELVLIGAILKYADTYGYGHEKTTALECVAISYLISGAVVHGLHHHWGRAAESIVMRAAALAASGAVILLAVGAAASSDGSGGGGSGVAGIGAGIVGLGIVGLPFGAMAIDDTGLARDRVPAAAPAQTSWTPTLRIQSGLALAGILGSF